MKKIILKIGGMSCSACQNKVEKYLNKQDGVNAVVNLVMQNATIEYDEDKYTLEDIERFVKESGYVSLGLFDIKEEEKKDRSLLFIIILSILMLFLMYISMGNMLHLPMIEIIDKMKHAKVNGTLTLLITIVYMIYGYPILKSGITKLIDRSPNMDSLVSIGVITSFLYSSVNLIVGNYHYLYFESCAMIILFISIGRYIDKRSKEKTKSAIKDLVTITPSMALLKNGKKEVEITIDEVMPGDILICKPGMKIAVDGVIVDGETHMDEAFITGESTYNKKSKNDKVLAGSINIDGYIEYKAQKIGYDSTISEIIRLVVEATNTKMPIQRIVDKISSIFVPAIMIIAILTFIGYLVLGKSFDSAVVSFVTVLVVSCPCALGLATPLAIVVSEGKCAKKGILIKDSSVLENTYKMDTIVFDKTGTLTYGTPKISSFNNFSKYDDNKLMSIIYSLEHNSNHPIARAFKGDYELLDTNKFKSIDGIGIYGEIDKNKYYIGNNKVLKKIRIKNDYSKLESVLLKDNNTVIYVIENKKIISVIGVKDIIKENAKIVIRKILGMNKDVIVLSGDNEETTKLVAKELGIKNVIANVLPMDKDKTIEELKVNNHKVMMFGDGINDAPSLVRSDIGVSFSSGTDIAANSSMVILMNNDLSCVLDLINISKKTIRIIKQNLFWAFFYNICMIPIAIGLFKSFGIEINPVIAAIAMTISSLTVVLNSLRLK